jgi:hypothetical protein
MAQNPYDLDTDHIKARYMGFEAGVYCFRIGVANGKGLESIVYEMELFNWLNDNTNGKFYMGNSFPYADHPPVSLDTGNPNDSFVLFERFSDVIQFERDFATVGLTPSMLV